MCTGENYSDPGERNAGEVCRRTAPDWIERILEEEDEPERRHRQMTEVWIFLILVAWSLAVAAFGHMVGYEDAQDDYEEMLENVREDLEDLMKDINIVHPIKKYSTEHRDMKYKVLRGEIDVEEYVEEYNKLIKKESEDMERCDPPGRPHEHI